MLLPFKQVTSSKFPQYKQQSGNTLMIGLLMLVVIAIVTVASMQIPTVEMRMAHNTELQAQALAAAESGLRTAEKRVDAEFNGVPTFDFDANEDDCLYNGEIVVGDVNWCNDEHDITELEEDESAYLLEYLGPRQLEFGSGTSLTDRYYFRITGHGQSGTGLRRAQTVMMTADLPE